MNEWKNIFTENQVLENLKLGDEFRRSEEFVSNI
jgi:hypothetical protein